MNVLLLNAGSSSLKFSLMNVTDQRVTASGMADWAGQSTHYQYKSIDGSSQESTVPWRRAGDAVKNFVADLERDALSDRKNLSAVGHRWVHGGEFTEAVRVTPVVRKKLAGLVDLAPLHNPGSLDVLDAAMDALPGTPHIVSFDTAFHATLSPEAYTYAIPRHWTREWGLRRYGFHGLSYAYCARRAGEMLNRANARMVVCHLGQGCSATAIQGGKSVDTTMGFTPLDGLVMATRIGSVDPSLLFHAQRHHGLTVDQLESVLNEMSGLLGISGVSGDLREVTAAARAGNVDAELSIGVYTHRLTKTIAALAATIGGLDALVFTAGVGEHSADIRMSVCSRLAFLGIEVDPDSNLNCHPDADIASKSSRVRVLVIRTREDLTMLQDVMRFVGPD
jgi:acetate kinase